MSVRAWVAIGLTFMAVAAVGCRGRDNGAVSLTGAGATFPYPIYSKWIAEYRREDPGTRLNYQSVGSGAGIRQLAQRTIDFGASDVPLDDARMLDMLAPVIHVPTVVGAVAVTYSGGAHPSLRLAPEALAGIFLGEITRWDDPRIAANNPGVTLPSRAITVVHRSDGSGTTAVFTAYLARVSDAWRARVGSGASVSWPVGIGAKGNEGVTGQIQRTPGAIGYAELAYAVQNQLPVAALRNRAGRFVAPTVSSISAAAEAAAAAMPDDLRVSIVDAQGAEAYPIASFTYVLAYQDAADEPRGRALARFLWWATHEGQAFASPLHYAPLPAAMLPKVEARIRALRAGGRPALDAP